MKKSVYIETSVISYYTNKPSRDIIIAARQQVTHEWWEAKIRDFKICTSELVYNEVSSGDKIESKKRIDVIKKFTYLDLNEDSYNLAKYLIESKAVPEQYPEDSLHIAVACVHGIDFLLTWNFKHINNAQRKTVIEKAANEYGYIGPVICTPEELIGDNYE